MKKSAAVVKRQSIERQICEKVIDDLLAAGFFLQFDYVLDDPDTDAVEANNDPIQLKKDLMACDEERLLVFRTKDASEGCVGWVYFVYGNDGPDVICDYTTNLEEHLAGANKLAEELEA